MLMKLFADILLREISFKMMLSSRAERSDLYSFVKTKRLLRSFFPRNDCIYNFDVTLVGGAF